MSSKAVAQFIIRWLLRGCLAAIPLFVIFMSVIYFLMQRDPEELTQKYFAEISEKTGLKFKLGTVIVTLLPLPSIEVGDVAITGPDINLTAAWISVRPDFPHLLRGDLLPARMAVFRPKLYAQTSLPLASPMALYDQLKNFLTAKTTSATGAPGAAIDIFSASPLLELYQAHAEIRGADSEKLVINGLECKLRADSDGGFAGDGRLAALWLESRSSVLFALENFEISGDIGTKAFWSDTHALKISGRVHMADILFPSAFNIDFEGSSSGWNAAGRVAAVVDLDGAHVPLDLAGRVTKLAQSDEIVFRALEWRLDNDNGRLDLALMLPANPADFSLKGTLLAHRLSLTQWLGFARNLSPGLQLALDNILQARLEFSLDARGLNVPVASAECNGARFSGNGSVADFKKPVVFLDLTAEKANLGTAVPESLGKSPEPPFFPYPPLTPMPGKPLAKGETGIGYDIRLAAKQLQYGPLEISDAHLRIYQGKMDIMGLEDVLLDARGKLYGGTVKGHCILGADKSLPISIEGSAKDVNGAPLAAAMPAFPFRQGHFQGSVNVMSRGKKLGPFLANLKGRVAASGEKALLGALGAKTVFSSIEADASLRGAVLDGKRAGFDAKWSATLKSADYTANGTLDGRMWVGSGSGVTFKSLPVSAEFRRLREIGFLPPETAVKISAVAGINGARLDLAKAQTTLPGLKIGGAASVDMDKPSWTGSANLELTDVKRFFSFLGIKGLNAPAVLSGMKASADFNGGADSLQLSKINANVAQNNISGNLAWQSRNGQPFISFSLAAHKLDLNSLMGSASGGNKNAGSGKWDFSFMRNFSAQGDLSLDELLAFGLKIQNLRVTARLNGGKLSVGPNTGRFYGSAIQSRGLVDFGKGLTFNAIMAAHDFDLATLAADRGIQSKMSGRASIDASVKASATGPGQLPGAINGDWSFSVRNGSWQSRNKNGKLEGSPTVFNKASASGKLADGVLRSDNFYLDGANMKVNGGGWLNLANDQINCDFNVNMKGLPDFPLHLYGTLKDSKTSIGAGKMVMNAIGGITSGFVNVLGGLVEGTWKIFR